MYLDGSNTTQSGAGRMKMRGFVNLNRRSLLAVAYRVRTSLLMKLIFIVFFVIVSWHTSTVATSCAVVVWYAVPFPPQLTSTSALQCPVLSGVIEYNVGPTVFRVTEYYYSINPMRSKIGTIYSLCYR